MATRNMALYGWVFKYNPYEDLWSATPDSNYFALSNGHNEDVLSTKGVGNINTLLGIINQTGGDKSKLKKLIRK